MAVLSRHPIVYSSVNNYSTHKQKHLLSTKSKALELAQSNMERIFPLINMNSFADILVSFL
jgi:hypothetical protein